MLKVYTEAVIKIVESVHFSNDMGEPVDYFIAYLKDDEGGVVKVNCGKNNFSEFEGLDGTCEIEVREGQIGGTFKLKLVGFEEKKTKEKGKTTEEIKF